MLFSHFGVNVNTGNIDKIVSMLFPQPQSNGDEHVYSTLIFNQLSTMKQNWVIDIKSTRSFNVVWTLFFQCWNNVDKHTSVQISFSTKFERWNNVGLSTLNRFRHIDRYLKNWVLKSNVHVIKHATFQLYRIHPEDVF